MGGSPPSRRRCCGAGGGVNKVFDTPGRPGERKIIDLKYKNNKDPINFSTDDHGRISGYFATFHHDHADSAGDVIRKGAFLKSIQKRKESGHPFALCFNHDFSVIVGRVTEIGEDDYGAWFKASFFPTEKAQEIREFVKTGVLWQFSFAYDVIDQEKVKAEDGSMVNELRELDLFEISIVTVPANDRAIVTDIKTARDKLLAYIDRIEKERKERILSYIREMEKSQGEQCFELIDRINDQKTDVTRISKTDLIGALDHLKELESGALADIDRYSSEGDHNAKARREQALEVIRASIGQIEGILVRR